MLHTLIDSDNMLFPKMSGFKKFGSLKVHLFSTLSFAVIILLTIHSTSFIPNLSPKSVVLHSKNGSQNHPKLVSSSAGKVLFSVKEEIKDDHLQLQPPINTTGQERIAWFTKVLPKFDILKSTRLSRKFEARVKIFLANDQCKIQFFMTWISPASSFRDREIFAIRSLFKAHPKGCLVILSRTLDTYCGHRILKPFQDLRNKILAVTPDLPFLFKHTTVESWFNKITKGNFDPGEIPFPQNLSNLVRLAVLYKYGGVYLDTDFITLNDFSSLRNTIGAQSVDLFGNWTRLNNAVLIFDKNHELLHKFLEEFASTFDGNRWGHNGPYLVSRVTERVLREENNFNVTVLPPMAFYPVDWTKIKGLFEKPVNRAHSKWVEAKVIQLKKKTYGVHLWNKQSSGLMIENGSVISRLISSILSLKKSFKLNGEASSALKGLSFEKCKVKRKQYRFEF